MLDAWLYLICCLYLLLKLFECVVYVSVLELSRRVVAFKFCWLVACLVYL